MCGPVVLIHQVSGEGKPTRDEEGACVLWAPPPYHPTTLRPKQPWEALTGLGGLGKQGSGRLGTVGKGEG